MNYPLHVILRKKISSILNSFLSCLLNKKSSSQSINKDEIQKILIIRPNYRIGNIIFLTPLINELHKHLPHAKIDIIVGMKLAGKLLEPMPNVDKIIDIPRKLLLHPLDLYRYIKDVRTKNYDIAFNISGASTSAQIVSILLKANYKASFHSDKLWADFTHIKTRGTPTHKHMGLESLEILRFFDIIVPQIAPSLDIKLNNLEISQAKSDLTTLLEKNNISQKTKSIAIFRGARFDKKLSNDWWDRWIKELLDTEQNIVIIDILSPDIPQKINNKVLEYSNKNLRLLGAFFHSCDMFVSADTGPMHLAVASNAKVLALFNKTDPKVYGALGDKSKTIEIENMDMQEILQITKEVLYS